MLYDISPVYWRGHQTSPTALSLKGRLPKKLQSQYTFSCEIVQKHSLLHHGIIKKRKSKNAIKNGRNLFLCPRFYLCIDLIANVFRWWIQNTQLFSSFIFGSIIYLFEKWKLKLREFILAHSQKDSLNYSSSLFKG